MGAGLPGATVPARRNISGAWGSAGRRGAILEEYKNRRDLLFVRDGIFFMRPRMVDLRRASLVSLRIALLRVPKHLRSSNTSVLEDA